MRYQLQMGSVVLFVAAMTFVTNIECRLAAVDEIQDGMICSEHCLRNSSDIDVCNRTTGDCIFGCVEGYVEPVCTNQCDRNCKTCLIDPKTNGVVCKECRKNFYRSSGKCVSCSYYCSPPNISSTIAVCREADGYCYFGCRRGRYGLTCGERCSATCKDQCVRETGICFECKYSSYCGPTCEVACQDGCALMQCNQSCSCMKGCTATSWGEKCNNLCNANCKQPRNSSFTICDKINGSCLYGCTSNAFWGTQCEKSCSANCVNGSCHQMTGICIGGCISGQIYGDMCTKVCNANCVNGTCDTNGLCVFGCIDGWYGEMCDKQCSEHCYDRSCNRSDGSCLNSCKSGWYGLKCTLQCSETCPGGNCDNVTGKCSNGYYKGPDLGEGSVCFGCYDMSSPQYCDVMVQCSQGEKCFLESQIATHRKLYRSGCMKKRCTMLEASSTSSVCVQCCDGNMCNNIGCGYYDFPTREHRGPLCLDCLHSGDPSHCNTVTMCARDQVCLIEKFQWGDGFHYKQGCVHKVCNRLSYHKRSIPLCHSCCDDDFCNWNCTSDASNNGEIFVG